MPIALLTDAQHELLRQACVIANRTVRDYIAERGVPTHIDGQRWLDTRPALDPHEVSGPSIDMMAESLAYAQAAGVVQPHPTRPGLVRLVWMG